MKRLYSREKTARASDSFGAWRDRKNRRFVLWVVEEIK